MAALSEDDPRAFIHDVMVSQIATALNIDPNDIDFIGKI